MKRLAIALLAVTSLGVAVSPAAYAADLPMKAPYVATAPAFSWTGCYVGVHAGAGVLLDQGFQQGMLDRHGVGGLAGGQVGCNYQTGMLVLGVEGEGFWSGMTVAVDQFGGLNTLTSTTRIKNKWDYDVAARFGIAFGRALVYGKAGWVAGGFDWNFATTDGVFSDRASATLDGLLVGLGLEYAFANSWTAKFEYDYLGYSAKNVSMTDFCGLCTPTTTTFTQSVSADKHIFKLGLNYKFF